MAKILIVEDEVLIAEQLKRYVERIGHICCGHATSYEEAIPLLNAKQPELVLLDIHLYGKRSGIEVAQYINATNKVPFIYLTSHFEKSTLEDAKNTYPAGYLTKPYREETLHSTIEICLFNHLPSSDNIEIIEGKKIHSFPADDICYIEADHVYVRFTLTDEVILIRKSLNEISDSLPGKQFIRVHKSFVVNLKHIRQVHTTYIVVNEVKIPIGRTFKDDVLSVWEKRF